MIELGIRQDLSVIKQTDFGIYLGELGKSEKVLLPKKQVPENVQIGDKINVFVYRDSEDRLIATINNPKLCLNQITNLVVREVTNIGAFLDWGLEKDLFLPFKEQTKEVHPGEQYAVALYIDKSNRLCATMKIYDYLREDSPFQKNDIITGIVYELHEVYGAFIAVENKYHGIIPYNEIFEPLQIGDKIEARVTNVREDGKLNLSIRKQAYLQLDEDAERVLQVINKYHGILPFTDKTVNPERVKKEFKLSKNAFKRAIGKLLKEKRIKITDKTIEKVD